MRRETVFPKVDAPLRARGLMGHALTRWPKGSVRDRLTPPGQFEGSAQGSYKVLWRSYAGPPQHILIARRAIPPPFEPFEPCEPSEPSEPSRRRCVQGLLRPGHMPTVSSSGSWQKSFMAPSAILPPSWAAPSTTCSCQRKGTPNSAALASQKWK